MFYYKFVQAHNVIMDAYISNIVTHCANCAVIFPYADLYDLQCVVVFCCSIWCSNWLLLIWMEKICYCRCYRTLSLVNYVFTIYCIFTTIMYISVHCHEVRIAQRNLKIINYI